MLCLKLAESFDLDYPLLHRAKPLRSAVHDALGLMTIEEVLDRLLEQGPLTGGRKPYGVLIWRARQLAEDARLRARASEEAASSKRSKQIDRAVHRGQTANDLVRRDEQFADEAERELVREFADEELLAFALDAFRGGPS